jgi:NADPH:quinone reductase-like Zn-dependent oxidoreductase
MKAIVCTAYGPPEVLEVRELDKPVPKHNQVLVRIHATAVTSSDCIVRAFNLHGPMSVVARLVLGVTRPRKAVLGMVLAGEIEAAGKDVSAFKEGDQVFGFDRFAFGAYAAYKSMTARGLLALKPSNLTYDEAAAIPYGGLLALYFLRKGRINERRRVLVYGASGSVGTSAVQLAKHFGAEVTGVCSSSNVEIVRSLGADAVIDYKKDDFTRGDERYDLVFVAIGNRMHPPSEADCKKALTPGGAYVSVDRGSPRISTEDLVLLKQLAEAGALKPVIDRIYPLEQMAEAHRYVDQGHKKGNVVITVGR